MHAETLAYILHSLPYEGKVAPPSTVPHSQSTARHAMVEVPAGPARLGRSPEEGFGWDNEFDAHTVEVPAFSIGRTK